MTIPKPEALNTDFVNGSVVCRAQMFEDAIEAKGLQTFVTDSMPNFVVALDKDMIQNFMSVRAFIHFILEMILEFRIYDVL